LDDRVVGRDGGLAGRIGATEGRGPVCLGSLTGKREDSIAKKSKCRRTRASESRRLGSVWYIWAVGVKRWRLRLLSSRLVALRWFSLMLRKSTAPLANLRT